MYSSVSFGQGLFISIFSMIVVFLVLLIISYLIDLVALIIRKSSKASEKDNDEISAVISGALREYIGHENFKIKSVKEK